MAEFDPDAFLKETAPAKAPSFDPDAFLAETAPDEGAWSAAGRGIAQGASFGYEPRIEAMTQAGGANHGEGMPHHLVKGMYNYWTGDKEAESKYNAALEQENQANEAAKKQHGLAYGAGEVAGSIPAMAVLPAGEFGAVGNAGRTIFKGIQGGAEYGAIQGSSEGEDATSRLTNTGVGAGVGAVVGTVGSAVGHGLELATKKVAAPIGELWRSWRNPESETAKKLTDAIRLDQEAIQAGKAKGMDPAEWIAARQAGEPVTLADLGAAHTQALLRSAANLSPEARNMMEQAIEERFLSQGARAQETVRNLVPGGANAGKTADQLVAEYDAARVPAYKQAYAAGDRPIPTRKTAGKMTQLMSSPMFKGAMQDGTKTAQDWAVLNNVPSFKPGATNLAYWDAVKKELDDTARSAFRAGNNERGSVASQLSKTLRDELDKEVPSYKNARSVAEDFFGERNALEAGRNLAGRKADPEQIKIAMRQMKPDEQELFREGYASGWANRIKNNIAETRDITKAMFNKEGEREAAEAIFGPAGLAKVQARMTLESVMDGARKSLGNSTTARQFIEANLAGVAPTLGAGIAGGVLGAGYSVWEHGSPLTGAGVGATLAAGAKGAATKAVAKVNAKMAADMAKWLTSDDLSQINRAVKTATANPAVMARLRTIANALYASPSGPTSGAAVKALPPRLIMNTAEFSGSKNANAEEQQGNPQGQQQPNRARGGKVEAKKAHAFSFSRATGGAVARAIKGYEDGGSPDYDPFAAEKFENPFVDKTLRGVGNALAFPGKVYQSQQPVSTEEMIGPAADIAGLTTLGAGAIPAEADSLRMGIKAYHGSPHDFEKFSLYKIGTGEGAQAYGHGLYFAENEGVAKNYKETLGGKGLDIRSAVEKHLPDETLSQDDLSAIYRAALSDGKEPQEAAKSVQMAVSGLRDPGVSFMGPPGEKGQKIARAIADIREKARGRMYEVDIAADPAHFLDWDRPLGEQPGAAHLPSANMNDTVAAILQRAQSNEMFAGDLIGKDRATVAELTQELANRGIPGIKYLDQGSRMTGAVEKLGDKYFFKGSMTPYATRAEAEAAAEKAGNVSRNYVVFDDSIINILRKYGLAGLSMLPPATAAAIRQQLQPGGDTE